MSWMSYWILNRKRVTTWSTRPRKLNRSWRTMSFRLRTTAQLVSWYLRIWNIFQLFSRFFNWMILKWTLKYGRSWVWSLAIDRLTRQWRDVCMMFVDRWKKKVNRHGNHFWVSTTLIVSCTTYRYYVSSYNAIYLRINLKRLNTERKDVKGLWLMGDCNKWCIFSWT